MNLSPARVRFHSNAGRWSHSALRDIPCWKQSVVGEKRPWQRCQECAWYTPVETTGGETVSPLRSEVLPDKQQQSRTRALPEQQPCGSGRSDILKVIASNQSENNSLQREIASSQSCLFMFCPYLQRGL